MDCLTGDTPSVPIRCHVGHSLDPAVTPRILSEPAGATRSPHRSTVDPGQTECTTEADPRAPLAEPPTVLAGAGAAAPPISVTGSATGPQFRVSYPPVPYGPLWPVRQVDYGQRGLQAGEVAAVASKECQAVACCSCGDLQVHAAWPWVAAVLAHEAG